MVLLESASISNGILEADGNGVIQGLSTPTLTNLTIQGTGSYVMPDGNDTVLVGTITNKANIQMNSTGSNTDLLISGDVTLNGGGTVTMGNSPANRFYSPSGANTITNADNTIQGAGQLGVGLTGIINNGTILANQSNTLFVDPNATGLTNNGTLQVNSGSLMHVLNGGPFNNFSGSTLAGGAYVMNDGTLQIDQLGNTGGEITTLGDGTTATSVILNGASATTTDLAGNNAFALATINANASLTIENGNLMTTPGALANAGTVTVGNASTLTIGGTNAYTQSGGTTQGVGTITGNVTINGGTILPGLPNAPGTLSINGNFTHNGGTFGEQILNASTFGVLNVTGGNITLGANADLNITLLNGFDPVGNTYTILNDTGGSVFGTFANAPGSGFQMDGYNWTAAYNSNDIVLDAVSAVGGLVTATWNTGTGNWTTATQWSCNPAPVNCVPNNNSSNTYDAVLNSTGAGDTLTLDNSIGPITIDGLTLTAGTLDITSGASLNVLNNGITDIPAAAGLILAGTFTNGAQSGLAGLTSVEGTLTLENGQTTGVTPGGGTLTNSGTVNVQQSSTLAITGALTNFGTINTGNGASDTGNNSLTVSGTLTNSNGLYLRAIGDSLTANGITNSGSLALFASNQTVTDTGDLNNSGFIDLVGQPADKVTVAGNLTNIGGTGDDGTVDLEGANDSLSVSGTVTSSGTIEMLGPSQSVSVTGSLTNSGTGSQLPAVQLSGNLDSLTVGGTFNNNAGASVTMSGTNGSVSVTGTFNNGGTVTLSGNGDTLSAASFSNGGGVSVGAGEKIVTTGNYTLSGGSLKVNGTLQAAIAFINGGTVSGGGTIVGNVNNGGGIVTASDPGSPTILTINGNYTQGGNGTLEAFLGGVAAGSGYSQLDVTGTATLGGTLDVDLATGSFTPAAGEDFFLLLAGGGLGGTQFGSVDFADAPALPNGDTWQVIYNAGNVELQVNGPTSATPEPSSLILFGTALAMGAFLGLRKVVSSS